jgi:predicted DNA-binding transcriptional regulator YafY
VARAQAKLERVMPAALMRRVRAVDETVALDLTPPVPARDNVALAVLSAAAQARQRVRMTYRAASRQETEREFDPYAVAWRGGCWYAVGVCQLRGGLRSFRIDRVLTATPLAQHFTRPRDFDVLGYLALNIATLPRAHAVEVLLKTELAAARALVPQALGVLERVPDGVLLLAQADDLDWFARWLAGLSCDFAIRRPAALKTALAACARRLARLARSG